MLTRCVITMALLLAVAGVERVAQSSPSPKSPSKSSPKPPTPEQQLAAARARLVQAQAQVKATWAALKQSRQALAQSQREHSDVLEQLRRDEMIDPVVLEATQKAAEARDALELQRIRALAPLKDNLKHQRERRTFIDMSIRLDELTTARRLAQERHLPFERALELEIGDLSLRVLKAQSELEAFEDAMLEEHAGYQAASEALDKALGEAAEAMKASKELREGNAQRKAAFAAMQSASSAAAAAGKAYSDARRYCRSIVVQVANAQAVVDRPGRR